MPLAVRLDTELETGLRRLIREHLVSRAKRRNAFTIAAEFGVVGMDTDPRRNVAKRHSKYLNRALRGSVRSSGIESDATVQHDRGRRIFGEIP